MENRKGKRTLRILIGISISVTSLVLGVVSGVKIGRYIGLLQQKPGNNNNNSTIVYENAFVNDVSTEQLETSVENAVYNASRRGYKCVELRFDDSASLNTAKDTLFNTGVIYTIYKDVGLIKDLSGAKVYYSTDEKMNALCLFFWGEING